MYQTNNSKHTGLLIFSVVFRIISVILTFILAFNVLGIPTIGGTAGTEDAKYLLGKVAEYLKTRSVYELTDEEITYLAAIGGTAMLQAVDGYGYLLTPEQYYEITYPSGSGDMNGTFGFTFTQHEYLGMYVHSVVADSSVYGKMFEGDIITAIRRTDGTAITFTGESGQVYNLDVRLHNINTVSAAIQSYNSVSVTLLRGGTRENIYQDGTEITLIIERGGFNNENDNGFSFIGYYFGASNTNVSAKTQSLRSLSNLDGTNIAYISISSFGAEYIGGQGVVTETTSTASELKSALQKMKAAGKTKLILDLQNNRGGDLDQVVAVAGMLIYDHAASATNKNLIVARLSMRDSSNLYRVDSTYSDYFTPGAKNIVVLTNGESASASELLVGVMDDYGTAVQVGTTTFGKGIAQYCVPIMAAKITISGVEVDSYWAIYYTAAMYYTASGTNIHGVGYAPDAQNVFTTYVAQIQRAKTLLGS